MATSFAKQGDRAIVSLGAKFGYLPLSYVFFGPKTRNPNSLALKIRLLEFAEKLKENRMYRLKLKSVAPYREMKSLFLSETTGLE